MIKTSLKTIFVFLYILSPVVLTTPVKSSCKNHQQGSASSLKYLSNSKKTKLNLKNIENLVVFGDSYTDGHMDYETLKSDRNSTSANGPNWVYFLSDYIDEMNKKKNITVYNFASSGSLVTREISPTYAPEVLTFSQQIYNYFIPKMVNEKKEFPWKSENTLFGVWFGINDTGMRRHSDDLTDEDMEAINFLIYFRHLDKLYKSGARHFLILNIPAVNFSPFAVSSDSESWMERLHSFNKQLPIYVKEFSKKHRDANIFLYNSYDEFYYIRENYKKYGIEEIDEYCENIWDPNNTCLPIEKYYWINNLHPTSIVHKAMTNDLIKFIKN